MRGAWCIDSRNNLTFPPKFKFGIATDEYLVEGSWNVSDKTESIWDSLLHTQPSEVLENSNGDIACDSYQLWKWDIEMLEDFRINMYRFSISWSGLLPFGFSNIISEYGKRYNNDLINGLLKKGIELDTMYHGFHS